MDVATAPRATTRARGWSWWRRTVRRQILAVAALGVLTATVIGMISVAESTAQGQAVTRLATLQRLTTQIGEIRMFNSDVSGWQVAYAWDTRKVGGPAAVDATSANRAGFLDSKAQLETALAAVEVDAMTAQEQELFATVQEQWDAFFAVDDRAVAAYQAGTPADLDAADALIVGEGYDAYYALWDATSSLEQSLAQRVDEQTQVSLQSSTQARLLTAGVLAVGAVLCVVLAVVTARRISRAVQSVRGSIAAMAAGDLTVTAPVRSLDELAAMAAQLDEARESLRATVAEVVEVAHDVAQATGSLEADVAEVAAGSQRTSATATQVATSAGTISREVQSVAAGSDQMDASIGEIAQNASQAAKVAAQATDVAAATNEQVARLGVSSQEIGAVVKTITQIAEQTNLLALNATIEAARAGEAGKGFAVVAGEVKDLAQETAKATEDIARRVEAIQSETGGAVEAIGQIAVIVAQINDYQTTIAAAVEEQTVTTAEMGRGIGEAASGSGHIAEATQDLATAAAGTSGVVHRMDEAVAQLAARAAVLAERAGRFAV